MDWLKKLLADNQPTHSTHRIFGGTWNAAESNDKELTGAVATIMTFALNAEAEDGGRRGVRRVGDKMLLHLNGVIVASSRKGGKEQEVGDYEIEIRRKA